MADQLFQTLDVVRVQNNLVELLCRTAKKKGRIEIDNGDGTSCVMISKEELDDLERALEILADSEAGQAMHTAIKRFAVMSQNSLPGPS
jgi:hypothetical protein